MSARITALLDKRASAWEAMKAIRERATEYSDLPAEDRAAWDKADADIERLSADIDREERAEAISAKLDKIDRSKLDTTVPGAEIPSQRTESNPDAEYREVFIEWARNGTGSLDREQRQLLRKGFVDAKDPEFRALGVGTGGAGGYAVPQGFRDILIERMKYFNAVRQVATIITTDSGNTLPWPLNDDTGNVGAILAENTGISQQDVVLTQAQLGAYMYTSKLVLVSWQLLQDSAIDIETFLARKLGQRIGRIQNQHFTTGTGTSQPLGIITGGTALQAAVGSTFLIKYADLVKTVFGVDPAYRNGTNVRWMWSDTALSTIRQLVDSQGRPLWEPSVQSGVPPTLMGYPILINNDLAVPAANAKSGAFGDFEAGYVIRDVTGVQTIRLDERYADALQVGFFAFERTDATVQDTSAYVVFQQSAT
ncbi:MAG: phage major capsid protein [Pseudonocardiales bacterium]|nr:phage major capsid protein [Pseudonocardiales bacterium]